tara:strand:+ start:9595 stop:17184 length:7590 start_codon:yes stop_codon:yes gene_type:complete
MSKSIDRKYSVFIAGYYDDFNASRAIADDENNPNITGTHTHANSHHGNPTNDQARLNPRYTKSYKQRLDGDETHNSGAHEWLTNDPSRNNSYHWEGRAQPSYPDGFTQGNRRKFGADTALPSYQLLTNGYNTSGHYSVYLGETDPSYGKSDLIPHMAETASNLWLGGGLHTGSRATNPIMQYASMCNVHLGEISPKGVISPTTATPASMLNGAAGDPFTKAILEPIESLDSGKPFLTITTHTPENKDIRLVSYANNLGATGDNDIFGIRMAWRNWTGYDNGATPPVLYTIECGFHKNAFDNDTGYTITPAATHTFTTAKRDTAPVPGPYIARITEASGVKPGYQDRSPWMKNSAMVGTGSTIGDIPAQMIGEGFDNGGTTIPSDGEIPNADSVKRWQPEQMWNDFEFKFNFTAGTYDVLHDGIVIDAGKTIGTNPLTSVAYTAEEMYGWQVKLNSGVNDGLVSVGTDTDQSKLTTMFDRTYMWKEVADPSGSGGQSVSLDNMKIQYRSNGISNLTLKVCDSSDNLNIFSVFQQETNQLQELLLFRDNIHRCIWRGHVEKLGINQSKPGMKDITINARDFLASMDRSLPIWEIGQGGEIDDTEPVGWRPYESSNFVEKMHFGVQSLQRGTKTLGFEKPNYKANTASRMRLHSSHPIQMYNEEGGAPNEIYRYSGTYSKLMFEKPSTLYANSHSMTNPLRVHATAHGYVDGESLTITDSLNYNGTYTVRDPQTNFFYIDKAYTPTGSILSISNNLNYDSSSSCNSYYNRWKIVFKDSYVTPTHNGGPSARPNFGKEQIVISDTKVLRESGTSGERNKRTDAFKVSSTTTLGGITVAARSSATAGNLSGQILDLQWPTYNKHSHSVIHNTSSGGTHNVKNRLSPATFADGAASASTNYSCKDTVAEVSTVSAHPGYSSFSGALVPYDSLYRAFGYNKLPGPNTNTDSWQGQSFDSSMMENTPQADWKADLAMAKINSQGSNPMNGFVEPSNNFVHGGPFAVGGASYTVNNPITRLYFSNADEINSTDLYVGQKIVMRYAREDLTTLQPAAGRNSASGSDPKRTYLLCMVFEITGFSNMLGTNMTQSGWNDQTHYLDVVQVNLPSGSGSGSDQIMTYDWLDTMHPQNNGAGAPSGTAGYSRWFLMDSSDLYYSNETGIGTVSAANAALVKPSIQRNIHSRWIQDMPKSLWFQKTFGNIKKDKVTTGITSGGADKPDATMTSATFTPSVYRNGVSVNLDRRLKVNSKITAMASAGGVGEFVNPDGTVDGFTFTGLSQLSSGGYARINGVKFARESHAGGSIVRIREIDNDYKHIWILWADMRNDGNADADGGTRKSDFGLMMPIGDNYNVSLEYVDSENIDGSPMKFADLKIGEDLDIWELDSTKEPGTEAAWSALTGASNSESESTYHNWENKGGAFLVVDTSKFWNINTEANAGKTGKNGGGRTDLQDYFAVNLSPSGPIMQDNYWIEAMNSYKNVQAPFTPHPNQMEFIHDASLLSQDLTTTNYSPGGGYMYLDDVSDFADSGVGRIVAADGNGTQRMEYTYWFVWTNRDTSLNRLEGVKSVMMQPADLSSSSIRASHLSSLQAALTGGYSPIGNVNAIVLDDYDSVTAYNSLAPINGMMFMMRIAGKIETKNSGTWYEHDKLRFLDMASQTKHWLGKSQTTGITDLANTPITKDININSNSWVWAYSGSTDVYGSATDCKGESNMSSIAKIQKSSGVGVGGTGLTFTYQIGRDGRLEFRPGYSSFFNFTRNTLNISNMKTSVQTKVTNVRLYFNGSKSFCDYPETVGDENIRWKIIDMPEIGTINEAKYIAKQEYLKHKKAPISISAKVVRGLSSSDVMLDGARYGYIADPSVSAYGMRNQHWYSRTDGTHFNGKCNALDGQINNTTVANVGSSAHDAALVGTDSGYPTSLLWKGWNYWYGANSLSNAIQLVHAPQNFPKYSSTTGNQLRVFITLNGFKSGSNITASSTLEEAADAVRFRLFLVDPIFKDDTARNTGYEASFGFRTDGTTPNVICESEAYFAESQGGYLYNAKTNKPGGGTWGSSDAFSLTSDLSNGFSEIVVPPMYWVDGNAPADADKKIIVSVNTEYLKAILRNRCGTDPTMLSNMAHKLGSPLGATFQAENTPNPHSLFPLGGRHYAEMGSGNQERYMWQAPRLIINDDVNFKTATAATYSDSTYGFTNKPLIINDVNWTVKTGGQEDVTLGLTTDESHFLNSISTFIAPPTSKDPVKPPSGSGGTTTGRGGEDGEEGEPMPDDGAQDDPIPNPKPKPQPEVHPGLGGNQTGYSAHTAGMVMGVNNMSSGMLNRIKGKMQFPVSNGDWALLGQERPLAAAIGRQTLVSNDGAFTPSSGTAALSETGITLPGQASTPQGDNPDTTQKEVAEVSGIQIVPSNAASNLVSINTGLTFSGESDQANPNEKVFGGSESNANNQYVDGQAVVYTTVTCVETGDSATQETAIALLASSGKQNLFTKKVNGADVPGNHLEIKIERVAGEGNDTALHGAIKLSSISVEMDIATDISPNASDYFNTA